MRTNTKTTGRRPGRPRKTPSDKPATKRTITPISASHIDGETISIGGTPPPPPNDSPVEQATTGEIKISPVFQRLAPAQTPETNARLEESVLAEGIRDDLVVWRQHNILLDGHHRFALSTKHGLPFKVAFKDFEDESAAMEWTIRWQVTRRNLSSPYSRIIVALQLENVYAARAKARMVAGKKLDPEEISSQGGRTRDEIAKLAEVSSNTVGKVKLIELHAPPEVKEALRQGTAKINSVYNAIRRALKLQATQWTDREKELRQRLESGETVVLNMETDLKFQQWSEEKRLFVRIDRGSVWGNPFVEGKDGDRDQVCKLYANHYLPLKASLLPKVAQLKGKALACWCAPLHCHGDHLADLANDKA